MRYKVPLSKKYIVQWLPLAFVITVLSGLIYTVVQQDIRIGGNEPQLHLATDLSGSLSAGQDASAVVPRRSTNIGVSTSPFVIVYDEAGKPTSSSVDPAYQTLAPPPGVFEYTRKHGEDRITWEPRPGLRIATIVQHYNSSSVSGFVLAGSNMREIENNESFMMELTALGWLVAMTGSLGLIIITEEMLARG